MAKLLRLTTHKDQKGDLTVIEKNIPFDIKRVYYIYNVDKSVRGGHRHLKTIQAAICISGSCVISCKSNSKEDIKEYKLSDPDVCLIINPEDYHTMHNFTKDAVLLVLASEFYNPKDYIDEQY
jgi:dTDP-4-dehydrorhamnose 3,5-epimerase-like enzyme